MRLTTPFLDGFSTRLRGSSKTSGLRRHLDHLAVVRSRCPGPLSAQLADVIRPEWLEEASGPQRRRHFSHEVTFWAFLNQILEEDGSCANAVAQIQSWLQEAGRPLPSTDTSSFCKARQRLPLSMLVNIHRRLQTCLDQEAGSELLWRGHVVKAIDGSSVQLPDTEGNQREYPQHSGQKIGCGFPVMQLSALLNLSHGGWQHVETCSQNIHDHDLVGRMLPQLEPGEVLTADRAFSSYETMGLLNQKGCWLVSRLHQARKVDWRKGRKVAPDERIVTWKRPAQSIGSNLSAAQWKALPKEIKVRLIRRRVRGRDGKTRKQILVTNLLDHEGYPADEIADLYWQRWQIELSFRDLKTTMGMEMLRTKTPEMARKELWMFLIASNAMRLLMLRAVAFFAGSPLCLSFKGACQALRAWRSEFRGLHNAPRRRAVAMNELLWQFASRIRSLRPDRHEPRAIKRRPKSYQYLTASRHEFQEVLHRNRYRKKAR